MTIAAYQTLYESSIAFGMRKALMAEQKKVEMEAKIKQLQTEKKVCLFYLFVSGSTFSLHDFSFFFRELTH